MGIRVGWERRRCFGDVEEDVDGVAAPGATNVKMPDLTNATVRGRLRVFGDRHVAEYWRSVVFSR